MILNMNNVIEHYFYMIVMEIFHYFSYIDKNSEVVKVVMENKDGIFFQGTKTYYSVTKSNDKDQIRRIIDWQYIEDPTHSEEKISICSELKGKPPIYNLLLTLTYMIIFYTLITYIYNNIKKINVSDNNIYILTILVIIYSIYISKYPSTYQVLIKFYLFCLTTCGFNIKITILLFNYIIITEKILEDIS